MVKEYSWKITEDATVNQTVGIIRNQIKIILENLVIFINDSFLNAFNISGRIKINLSQWKWIPRI